MIDHLGPYLLGPNDTPENGIYTGDARELAKAIPDESVDLVFTDPPYPKQYAGVWPVLRILGETLRNGRRLMTLCGHYQIPEVLAVIGISLTYDWIIANTAPGKTAAMFQKRVWATWKPCLVFRRGTLDKYANFANDLFVSDKTAFTHAKEFHRWGQGAPFFAYYIDRWSEPGDIIVDPFTGGGTVPAVCKMLGRRYLAFEIDPDTAQLARDRVRDTQPPLFVPEPEQLPFDDVR